MLARWFLFSLYENERVVSAIANLQFAEPIMPTEDCRSSKENISCQVHVLTCLFLGHSLATRGANHRGRRRKLLLFQMPKDIKESDILVRSVHH
jgi:hypothetical protein